MAGRRRCEQQHSTTDDQPRSLARRLVRHPRRGQLGATLPEYVIFVALFVLIALAAVGQMNSGAKTYFAASSSRIGNPVNHDQNATVPPTSWTSGGGGGPGTTGTIPTTAVPPTTIAPTTVAPTTVAPTTAAPTTTRAPATTTTTTPARRVSASVYSHTLTEDGGGFGVQLTGTGGASVSNITVTVSRYRNGSLERTYTCRTNSSGQCTGGPYEYTWRNATWQVTNVNSPNWDGVKPSVAA